VKIAQLRAKPSPTPTIRLVPTPTPVATAKPTPVAVVKRITCVKGKATQKVTAIWLTCPHAYEKK